jgi:hypothetical protein
MAEPENMIIPLLQEMRADLGALQQRMDARFDKVEKRLDKMDESLVTFRHALSADSYFGNVVTGELMERMDMFERRLSELEKTK